MASTAASGNAGWLYFAYGSNLNRAQVAARCPLAQPVGPLVLKDYRLKFAGEGSRWWGPGGVATIVPSPGSMVQGALYRLGPGEDSSLDRYEGIATGRYRRAEDMIAVAGEPALVYVGTELLGEENWPSAMYLETIRQGYRDWGLPLAAIEDVKTYSAPEL